MPVERLREAVSVGLTQLGESRVQEAAGKIAAVPGASWHMVGRLQSNKAARAVELFDVVHSVDSVALAQRLSSAADHAGRRMAIFLQANVDGDPAKAGFPPDELERELAQLGRLPALELRGLMTIGRFGVGEASTRATFGALRGVGDRLREVQPRLGSGLSMGMSDDFELAVEEGATVVRVGRALFGERTAPN